MDTNNQTPKQKPYRIWKNLIKEFLWSCSGADKEILRKCPTEYAKYAGIGGTILFTALMAMLSGGYAISMVFEDNSNSIFIGTLFGIFWGLLIFNLDRFMVNTMYSDGTHKITKEELKGGIPRLVLAIFIGIVISVPIELRIFKDKIDDKLVQINRDYAEQVYGERMNYLDSRIIDLERANDKIDAENNRLGNEINEAFAAYDGERIGASGSKRAGYGPNAIRRETEYNRINGQNSPIIANNNAQRNKNNLDIAQYQIERDSLRQIYDAVIKGENSNADTQTHTNGFTNRLTAFNEVTLPWKEGNWAVCLFRFLVMFLFIVIEIIPTLFKMMMTYGPYDKLVEEERHRQVVISMQNVSNLNDDINTQIQISTEKNRQRLEAELKANENVLTKIAAVQAELLEVAIEEWRKEELEKIKANPSQYIQSNTTKA